MIKKWKDFNINESNYIFYDEKYINLYKKFLYSFDKDVKKSLIEIDVIWKRVLNYTIQDILDENFNNDKTLLKQIYDEIESNYEFLYNKVKEIEMEDILDNYEYLESTLNDMKDKVIDKIDYLDSLFINLYDLKSEFDDIGLFNI